MLSDVLGDHDNYSLARQIDALHSYVSRGESCDLDFSERLSSCSKITAYAPVVAACEPLRWPVLGVEKPRKYRVYGAYQASEEFGV